MATIDEAYKALEHFEREDIAAFLSKPLSETDTRSKIIDAILIRVLGWTEHDIEREGSVHPGYFDYEVSTPVFGFVIEAKRTRSEFKLPAHGNRVKLRTIEKANQEAIKQIRLYLFERSLQYGVLTNGTQFIIAKFVGQQGGDWKDNEAIFFRSLEDVKKDFLTFYELLSRESVVRNTRIKISNDPVTAGIIVKQDLPFKHSKLNRNHASPQLIPILTEVFEGLYRTENLTNKELLQYCYVDNDDVKKKYSELQGLLVDKPPTFDARIARVQNTKNAQLQIKDDLFSSKVLENPIVVIGNAGAGKTTFIRNFLEVVLTPQEKKSRPTIYVDFTAIPASLIGDAQAVCGRILERLYDDNKDLDLNSRSVQTTIYKKDIETRKNGIWKEPNTPDQDFDKRISDYLSQAIDDNNRHLTHVAKYLHYQCRKTICLVLDNADQLEEPEQKQAYLLAHSLSRSMPCVVVISLREGYFHQWKDLSPFNAYAKSTVYHITAPPYREVLRKRINYVLEHYEFYQTDIELGNKRFEFKKGSLKTLFENLSKALFEVDNPRMIELLERMSYPNIRAGLELFHTFLLSGHTQMSDYMALDYGGRIPFWEFVKSIALDSEYYYSDRSKIFNLFKPGGTGTNHFIKLRILKFLAKHWNASPGNESFVPVEQILLSFGRAGYSSIDLMEDLNELYKGRLIASSDYSSDRHELGSIVESSRVTITIAGKYYLDELVCNFAYVDLTLQTTPIFDSSFFAKINGQFPVANQNGKRDLKSRIETARIFIEYLKAREIQELSRDKNDDEDASLSYKFALAIEGECTLDFERITTALSTRK